jgi:DinB family protein
MSSVSVQPATNQLAQLRHEFEACSALAVELTASVSEKEFTQRPASDRWSVADCLQHLTATTRLYLPILETSLQNAPSGAGPFKMDWRGRLLKWVLEPPYRSRVKTMASLEPRIDDPSRVLPDFLASQQQLIGAMGAWQGRDLGKVVITSPFSKRLRYNIYSLFNVVAAHQRHHLWQAQRAKDQIKGK